MMTLTPSNRLPLIVVTAAERVRVAAAHDRADPDLKQSRGAIERASAVIEIKLEHTFANIGQQRLGYPDLSANPIEQANLELEHSVGGCAIVGEPSLIGEGARGLSVCGRDERAGGARGHNGGESL